MIRYADRNGLLAEAAEILMAHLGTLEEAERAWLSRAWPAVAAGAVPSHGEVGAPDRERLALPVFDEHRTDIDPEVEAMWDGFVRETLTRAQRRAARQRQG